MALLKWNVGARDDDKDAVFWKLTAKPDNRVCFNCNAKDPTYGAIWFGIFICFDCSKIHDSIGSFGYHKSISSGWHPRELRPMILGGNKRAKVFFKEHGWTDDDGARNIVAKFTSNEAELYRISLSLEATESLKAERESLKECALHLSEHIEETDLARRMFPNGKSISSSQFFEDEEKMNDIEAKVYLQKFSIEETDLARRKFPNAKSISSSQFFEDEEKMNDVEAKVYLQKFSNSTAISSADFFKCKVKNPPPICSTQYTMDQVAFQTGEDCTRVEDAVAERLGSTVSKPKGWLCTDMGSHDVNIKEQKEAGHLMKRLKGTGEYDKFFVDGVYNCAGCGTHSTSQPPNLDDNRNAMFSHAKREGNRVAHKLTRLVCNSNECIWIDKAPIPI